MRFYAVLNTTDAAYFDRVQQAKQALSCVSILWQLAWCRVAGCSSSGSACCKPTKLADKGAANQAWQRVTKTSSSDPGFRMGCSQHDKGLAQGHQVHEPYVQLNCVPGRDRLHLTAYMQEAL